MQHWPTARRRRLPRASRMPPPGVSTMSSTWITCAGASTAACAPTRSSPRAAFPTQPSTARSPGEWWTVVERELVTPLGLRTLARSDPAYCPRYAGGVTSRDAAYHQGTVWPWLIGPFVDAWLNVNGDDPVHRAEARRRFLAPLLDHLNVAGLGHVSEIADGDPPHTPRGCPFQAWSLGELIRALARTAPADS